MVLRPTSDGRFRVVGECYVHGLSDAVGILGILPDKWKVIIKGDAFGRPTPRYVCLPEHGETENDPRLGPLHQNWERVTCNRSADDPSIFEKFLNLETGEKVDFDPRLFPDALIARGVQLEYLTLI